MSIDQPIRPDSSPETGTKRPRSSSNASPIPSPLKKRASVRGEAATRGFFIAFIDNAFRQLARGDPKEYHDLLQVFTPWLRQDSGDLEAFAVAAGARSEPPARMRAWLDALTHAMPRIDAQEHRTLIETILSMTWTAMDEACIGPYIRFTAALLGAKPEYIGLVLKRAIKGLHYHTGLRAQRASEVTRRLAYNRVHHLLQALIEGVPTVPSLFLRQLSHAFPTSRETKEAHVVYFRNVLRTVDYCPAFFEDVLSIVVEAALRVDAEIQVEIDDFEEDGGQIDQQVFGVSPDPFDRVVGEDVESEDDEVADDLAFSDISSDYEGQVAEEDRPWLPEKKGKEKILTPEVVTRLKDLAAKLDAMMNILFAFLDRVSKEEIAIDASSAASQAKEVDGGTELDRDSPKQRVYDTMLTIFERSILSTFKTRHTQFLIFWLLSWDQAFAERFIILLLNRALFETAEVPIVTRVAALCYLASFISRATFVDADSVRNVMGILTAHVAHHLDSSTVDMTGNSNIVQQHAIFYGAVQAAFYIFCFRWGDFVVPKADGAPDGEANKFVNDLDVLRRAVVSPFNPLRMCSANVATQFARVAHKVEFMYCFSVIEQNKRLDAAGLQPSAALEGTPTLVKVAARPALLVQQALYESRMDSHFPFDPYKLPLSGFYVTGLYREWQDPDDADDADDEDDAALGTPENGLPIPSATGKYKKPTRVDPVSGALGSFNAMSLSPLSDPQKEEEFRPMSLVL